MDDACVTSVKLSLSVLNHQSTCHISSYNLSLMSSGREISPHYTNASYYQFNELASNTRHKIQVTFIDGVNVHTMLVGHANTLASLRKLFSQVLNGACTCMIQPYIYRYSLI